MNYYFYMGALKNLRVADSFEIDVTSQEDAGFDALARLIGEIIGTQFVQLVMLTPTGKRV